MKELRIGNWVNYYGTFKQIEEGNQIEEVAFEGEPIPLTPEILEQCGFELDELPVYKIGFKYKIKFSKKNGSQFKINAGGKFIIIATIYYLHQLQNIFWCLTQTELEIKATVKV